MCFQFKIDKEYEVHLYEVAMKTTYKYVQPREYFVILDNDNYSVLHMVKCNSRNVAICISGNRSGMSTIPRDDDKVVILGVVDSFDYVTSQERDVN